VALAVADVDNDGGSDVIVANQGDDTISVLLGDRLGGFYRVLETEVGEAPTSLATGDFNTDGSVDLAVAGQTGITVLLGDRRGGPTRMRITSSSSTACRSRAALRRSSAASWGRPATSRRSPSALTADG
jgi:hypothetical protein